uniref:Uncharacterized protein n=1 Tax=Myoviridae sp. ct2AC8 TaxID=2827655 RepID=A0A8S5TPY5_9CAUD|nr:MAG TPA: hypothetical protein [Myoviridae sp. ct2AC8]
MRFPIGLIISGIIRPLKYNRVFFDYQQKY